MLMMKNCCFEWNAKYTLMPEAKESLQFFDAIWTHCARMRPIFASAAQFVCECEIISSILISSFERFTAAVSYSELYMCKHWAWACLCRWLWLGESHVSWPFCKLEQFCATECVDGVHTSLHSWHYSVRFYHSIIRAHCIYKAFFAIQFSLWTSPFSEQVKKQNFFHLDICLSECNCACVLSINVLYRKRKFWPSDENGFFCRSVASSIHSWRMHNKCKNDFECMRFTYVDKMHL